MNLKSDFTYVSECLYRHKSGGYYALVKKGGKQIRRSLGTKNHAIAKAKLREFRGKVERLAGDHANIRFEECAKMWLNSIKPDIKPATHRWRATITTQLKPFFTGMAVRKIGAKEMEAYKIRSQGIQPRNYNARLDTLRCIFAYAVETLRIIIENPADALEKRREIKKEPVIPTHSQFVQLFNRLKAEPRKKHAADFVEFLAYSGMRVGEATEAKWRNVDFTRKLLLVAGGEHGTKNYEERSIPLFPSLENLLKRLHAEGSSDPDRAIFKVKSIRTAMSHACHDVGLPRFTHHHFRHFFCSNAIEQGIPLKTIAAWLRHKDGGILVAKTYGHLRDEFSTQMAQKMTFCATSLQAAPESSSSDLARSAETSMSECPPEETEAPPSPTHAPCQR